MNATNETNDGQSTLWNGDAGHAWVEAQGPLDRMYKPFEDLLVDAVHTTNLTRVLDVGCGTGGTTLAIAKRLGTKGQCLGIDISTAMIDAARARAERDHAPVRFICADAQTYGFDPASVDMIVSRFGVMFFDDPIRAFANLRRAATDDAELRVIAWRSPTENAFMTTAERAAAPILPNLPVRQPDAPGQFGFANASRVHTILEQSGWGEIELRPIDVACTLPKNELRRYLTRFGPVGKALESTDEGTRATVIESILPAFDSFIHGADVRFTASCWTVGARAR